MSQRFRYRLQGNVNVSLSTNKSLYSFGEPVFLTAAITNSGKEPFYLYPHAAFEEDGEGVFILKTVRTPKCNMTGRGGAGTIAPPAEGLKFSDYVSDSWLLLPPGAFFGITRPFDKLSPLCPGTYTLSVTYLTELFWWNKDRIQASEGELKFPAAYGAYRGNTVTFRVRAK